MAGQDRRATVGPLPDAAVSRPLVPRLLTGLVWLLWLASLGVAVARPLVEGPWRLGNLVAVDGLTLVMWVAVTFFSGIVHSYSRRYMAGDRGVEGFFARSFAFTLTVLLLVAAESLLLFAAAWVLMGLIMADLVGHDRDWPQARAAARLTRRYLLAGGGLLAVAFGTLWLTTGTTTVSGVATAAASLRASPGPFALVAVALVLTAAVQSALVPFHGWLLGSMTAPTPASALMHAGFVNAGGILLTRVAPLLTVEPALLLSVAAVGATSALLGKPLTSVQPDVKRRLGCSTVGQMGFMTMQAGLGFFAAAITHLVLHGCYKAYCFLSAGGRVEHTAPDPDDEPETVGVVGLAATAVTAVAGGAVFALLTGKGTSADGGLLLALLVVLTTLRAARGAVGRTSLPATVRYVAVPVVFLPAIAVYGGVYVVVASAMADLPVVTAPTELHPLHAVLAVAFLLAYVAVERGAYARSRRLYVALVNATQPPGDTLLTTRREYDER